MRTQLELNLISEKFNVDQSLKVHLNADQEWQKNISEVKSNNLSEKYIPFQFTRSTQSEEQKRAKLEQKLKKSEELR